MTQDEILKILYSEACKTIDKSTEFKHGRTSGKMEAYSHAYTLVKKLTTLTEGSGLPLVCKGCGSLSTKVIDKKHLACCPDSNYIPMEEYCRKSIYPEEQFYCDNMEEEGKLQCGNQCVFCKEHS